MGRVVCGWQAADEPQRRVFASWRVYDKISHTGTDGIREYRREHCLFESQRGNDFVSKTNAKDWVK
ncbi:hypothetical protein SFRURICE_011883 [Spodoptera frugiperda]|nr:hypothetical protein SFRURICE_011883 [Spodoptera frugiperda]